MASVRPLAAVLVLLSGVTLIGQAPPARDGSPSLPHSPSETAIVRGRVVADDTGETLRKVRVTLVGGAALPAVLTGADGTFLFRDVPVGRYAVSARKAGYTPTEFGARQPGVLPVLVDVPTRAVIDGIELRMPPSAAISGRIVDEYGDPVEAATVEALRPIRVGGRSQFLTIASAVTDDLGEYRIGGLPAGSYLVTALLRRPTMGVRGRATLAGTLYDVTVESMARVYYPGVGSRLDAQAVDVHVGEERTIAGLSLATGRTARVSLAFTDADGNGTSASAVMVNETFGGSVAVTLPYLGGTVSTSVERGEWTIYARSPSGAGLARVSVGSDDVFVTIPLSRGARIAGRVISDGAPIPPGMPIDIEAFAGEDPALAYERFGAIARAQSNGRFELIDVVGVRMLRVRPTLPRGWVTKAILLNGRNILDRPIEFTSGQTVADVTVVLTNRVATLLGNVVGADRTAVADYFVVVFPDDSARLRDAPRAVKWARSTSTGRFTVADLAAGTYLAVAVKDIDETQSMNADYLNRFRGQAARLVLDDGEQKTVTLQLATQP
jgi:hypothetical protein